MVRPSSKYSREGTAAHKVAEMILHGDIFLPDKVQVEDQEFIVSLGMCRALRPYLAHVERLASRPKARIFIEQRVQIPDTDGLVWGTLDCGVQDLRGHIHIVDLKYGTGVAVAPDAPQLKLYALGFASLLREIRDRAVTLTVCQPRIEGEPLHSHTTTLYGLIDWQRSVVAPAMLRIKAGDPTEHAGHHCRWCVRRTVCKAFAERHQKHAAEAFADDPPC
jgi:hypothetical protein